MDTHLIIPRLITGLLSLLDSVNLRNRVYTLEERVNILELALADIDRINNTTASPNKLIANIVSNSLDL